MPKSTTNKKTGPKFPDVTVQLTGTDGNVFAIIGNVAKGLTRAGYRDGANEFRKAALACESYDDVLILCNQTVEVE